MLTQSASLPPRLLDDVSVWLFYPRAAGRDEIYIVGSITADRYLTVPGSMLPAVRAFIDQLDGRRSLDEARERMRERGIEMDVEALHRKFVRAGLVLTRSNRPMGDIQAASTELVRLPVDRLLRALSGFSRFGWPVTFLAAALIVTALTLAVFDPAFRRLTAKPAGLAEAVLIGTASVVFHELSHCYAASCRGIASGTVKAQLYLGVIPIVGLKLAGLYTLTPRDRLAVWGAGIVFNLTAAAAAMLALGTVAPHSPVLQTTAAFNWLLVVFNLMPLLPTDGYFLLSTLMRESNVRVRAWSWLRRPLHTHRRPSLFVLAYVLATVGLLLSTLWRLVSATVKATNGGSLWRVVSAGLLILFLVTLWRTFRRTEESGDA